MGIAFWINFFLFGIILKVLINLLLRIIETSVYSLRTFIGISILYVFIFFPWQITGLWRSCKRTIETYCDHFWARVVQVLIILSVLHFYGTTIHRWPVYKQCFFISFKVDDFAVENEKYTIELKENNTLIHLQGILGLGLSEEVSQLLRANPQINGVILDSPGGRIDEGQELANLIYTHDLNTYSLEGCYSAATIAFIAGKKRFLGVDANLGFHKHSYAYGIHIDDPEIEKEIQSEYLEYFIKKGIKRDFLRKIYKVPPDELWYPTVDELFDAGVIHGLIMSSDLFSEECEDSSKIETSEANLPCDLQSHCR